MTTSGGPARLLRLYGLWIVLVTAVVTAAGYAVSTLAPTVYRSQAIVVVEARVRANTAPVPPEMGTEKELARSGLVVEPAARHLGVDPAELSDGLTVTVAPDANVLTFGYTAADPVTAQRRAQMLAQSYVDYRNAADAPPAVRNAAPPNAQATLVTPASLPARPVARPTWIDLSIGLVLGLLLGVGTALLRDRMSDRVRGRADFERVAGVCVLATVPHARRPRGPAGDRPVLLRSPGSPAAESYRYLRSRLEPMLGEEPATVLVTSPEGRDGRTTTAANLALALALSGRTVILVDADLRHPRLDIMLGGSAALGLTTLLRGRSALAETLRDGPVPRLRLLPAGPDAAGSADLLQGHRLTRVLRTLRQHCDVVVLDSAAVLSVADAIALAARSDHVLLVGDYRRSTRAALGRAVAELRAVAPGTVSGVLVNAPRSAGGVVPQPAGSAVAAADDAPDDPADDGPAVPADRREPDAGRPAAPEPAREPRPRSGADGHGGAARPTPVYGSAVVPPVPAGPSSTLYASAAAAPAAPGAATPTPPSAAPGVGTVTPTPPSAAPGVGIVTPPDPVAAASAVPAPAPGAPDPAAAAEPVHRMPALRGPVKARANGVAVPAPRTGEEDVPRR